MSARVDGDDDDDDDDDDVVATVDVSLIDALLALTPEQRLLQNDRMLKTIQDLRDGFAAQLTTLLSKLAGSGAEFLLVGGLAAVAQGASLTTQDVDIVHRRTPENVDTLLGFLTSVNARYRERPDADLAPSRPALMGTGHNLFMTDLGPLDVLGAIEGGRDYEDLLPAATEIPLGDQTVRVLGLATLADLKRGSISAKDKLTLLVLEAALRRGRGEK